MQNLIGLQTFMTRLVDRISGWHACPQSLRLEERVLKQGAIYPHQLSYLALWFLVFLSFFSFRAGNVLR